MTNVVVAGAFDDLRSCDVRFLEEAARLGPLHVRLWSDETFQRFTGRTPKFNQEERLYFVQAFRYVQQVSLSDEADPDVLAGVADVTPSLWVVREADDNERKRAFCREAGLTYRVLTDDELRSFPVPPEDTEPVPGKKVVVTGSFDWLHTGHVRFFEETSALGTLYVVVGHDQNIALLKGAGHPLFGQDERRYMVQAIRYVHQTFISSGHGWMDAAPEIEHIKPDIYAVNEDGDRPEKRAFCAQHGLDYVVLKRTPKVGLPRRESTHLRGF